MPVNHNACSAMLHRFEMDQVYIFLEDFFSLCHSVCSPGLHLHAREYSDTSYPDSGSGASYTCFTPIKESKSTYWCLHFSDQVNLAISRAACHGEHGNESLVVQRLWFNRKQGDIVPCISRNDFPECSLHGMFLWNVASCPYTLNLQVMCARAADHRS